MVLQVVLGQTVEDRLVGLVLEMQLMQLETDFVEKSGEFGSAGRRLLLWRGLEGRRRGVWLDDGRRGLGVLAILVEFAPAAFALLC